MDGLQDRCRSCRHTRNALRTEERRIAYGLVGGERSFYSLDKVTRRELWMHAKRLHRHGRYVASAAAGAASSTAEGFVYVITHPLFNGYVKIGQAIDACSRLSDYQTYCPFRSFKLEGAVYSTDRRATEAQLHRVYADRRVAGEWFRVDVEDALTMLQLFREFDPRAFSVAA